MAKIPRYVLFGKTLKNGAAQSGINVTVRNNTRSEEHTEQTTADGKYSMTVTRTDWFPSGCYDGDSITISSVCGSKTFTINIAAYPWGRRIIFQLFELTEIITGTAEVTARKLLKYENVIEATHSVTYDKDLCLEESIEGIHEITGINRIFHLTEAVEGTPIATQAWKLLKHEEILETTHQLTSPYRLTCMTQTLQAIHQFASAYRIMRLTETAEGEPTLTLPLRLIVYEQIVQGIPDLLLPFRLWVLTEAIEATHLLSVHGITVYLTEAIEGLPAVTARRHIALEEILQGTHSLAFPLRLIAKTEPINATHLLTSPVHNLALSNTVEGTPIIYAMKVLDFTEILEAECGVDDVLIIVPSAQLILLEATLEATHQLDRHKTLFLSETVQGTPTTALPLKSVLLCDALEAIYTLVVPLHPFLFTQTLQGTHQLTAARIIMLTNIAEVIHELNIPKLFTFKEYIEGLPDLKLPQRPALLQEIITGLPWVATEFVQPTPFTTTLNIAGRNLTMSIKKRKLKLSVKKLNLKLRIRGERD